MASRRHEWASVKLLWIYNKFTTSRHVQMLWICCIQLVAQQIEVMEFELFTSSRMLIVLLSV